MKAKEHITVGSNSYKKVKNFKDLSSSLTNQNSIHYDKNLDLKQEILIIIQSKHSSCLPD